MPRVLLISPHFAPVNAPDMQRVRLMLPYLQQRGWETTVLAVAPTLVEGATQDELLHQTIPPEVSVHYSGGIPPTWTRPVGIGSLWLRCGRAFRRAGEALLAQKSYDLVFISTSQFDAFSLGPRWKRRFGVPYILDFQDPWVSDYFDTADTLPPGGKLKYAWSQKKAQRQEPVAVKNAGAIVCVSPQYGPTLIERYPVLKTTPIITLPFGASKHDFKLAAELNPTIPLIQSDKDTVNHVYSGRCTPNMNIALNCFLGGFKRFLEKHPAEAVKHRFHFIGTDYAAPGLNDFQVMPLAKRLGLENFVSETPTRIPYFESMYYMMTADSLMILGTDDIGYNPSKFNPCILSGRPLITIALCQSPLVTKARKLDLPNLYAFPDNKPETIAKLQQGIGHHWFSRKGYRVSPPKSALSQVLDAESMTNQLVDLFDQAIHQKTGGAVAI